MADTCPKCGRPEVEGDQCPGCGVIIPLYEQYLEKLRRGPRGFGVPTSQPTPPDQSAAPRETRRDGIAGASRSAPRTAPSDRVTRALHFHGRGGSLFGIQIVNALLTLVTLGVYYFWAKVKVRNYMLSQTELEADRFAYHGTGRELLRGFGKAMLVFFVPMTLINAVPELIDAGPLVDGVAGLLGSVLVLLFVPVAIVGARRYRLSRTSWRSIRFAFRGDTRDFIRLFVRGALLSGITLGVYYPVFVVRQYAYLTSHSAFGNTPFAFDGPPAGLLRTALSALGVAVGSLVALPLVFAAAGTMTGLPVLTVLGLMLAAPAIVAAWIWFTAAKRRFLWNHTTVAGARFHSTVTGRNLAALYAVNALLLVVTFGLALPWVSARNARFACRHLRLVGPIDLDAVLQAPAVSVSTTGEGLAGFLDTDLTLG